MPSSWAASSVCSVAVCPQHPPTWPHPPPRPSGVTTIPLGAFAGVQMVQWRECRTCGRVGIHNERLDGRGIYPVCRDRVLYHTCDSSIAWFGYSPHIHPERAAAALTYLVTARTGQDSHKGGEISKGVAVPATPCTDGSYSTSTPCTRYKFRPAQAASEGGTDGICDRLLP